MSRVLPILFNGDMVRAILDGRKTVTRRLIKSQPPYDVQCPLGYCTDGYKSEIGKFAFGSHKDGGKMIFCKPPYQQGNILYVRETWQYLYELDGNEQVIEDTGKYYYAATDTIPFNTYVDKNGVEHDHAPWKPSIHMPKEAARIWLKVTDVRVERLQEITEEQAKAEGAIDNRGFIHSPDNEYNSIHTAKEHFKQIWNSTIKKSDIDRYGWDASPWVWVIEFERCEKPEGV